MQREAAVTWDSPPHFLAYPNVDIPVSEIAGARITRLTRDGKVVCSVQAPNLRYPSDAFPIVDGLRHRVIVIDRKTKEIRWQYGVTDTPVHAPGYLFYPDGLDLDVFRDWRAALGAR